ncbi:MAG TPA: amino acid adenylation domain-containing protein [Blastocatellia bacterium]|nr:amino acid adenylation domain-containing protein [Blastocatellia bacterium]
MEQLHPGQSTYNVPGALQIDGLLSADALSAALGEIVRRHESLRTRFPETGGTPRQEVSEPATLRMWEVDLSGAALDGGTEQVEELLGRLIAEAAERPFDLATGPLFRVTLVRIADQKHVLVLGMHHIVTDGWSMKIFYQELNLLHAAYSRGEESRFTELPIQYGDYAVWQRDWLAGATLDEQLGYWRGRLSGAAPRLELPTDRLRPAIPVSRAGYHGLRIKEDLAKEVKHLSRIERATLFMTLVAAFQLLLSRYSGQNDIVVGTPIAGRQRGEVEGLIGLFVNTLTLRVEMNATSTFREILKQEREACLGAYAHQDVPFEKLVEELQPDRSPSYTPIFQTTFALQNIADQKPELDGLNLASIGGTGKRAKFDLSLHMLEQGERISGEIEYNTDLFDEASIQRMAVNYVNLMRSAIANPDQSAWTLPLLSDAELDQILDKWNQTQGDIPEGSLSELFETQAGLRPHSVSVAFEGNHLSYGELNRRANQLAHHLRDLGVGLESRVGIRAERGLHMIIGVLGILKAGAGYVPLDPNYPADRLEYMTRDAQPAALVAPRGWPENISRHDCALVELEDLWRKTSSSKENIAVRPETDNLAYVIYTSGSTGTPKGVGVTHAGIPAVVSAHIEHLGVTPASRVLAFASLSFDASFLDIAMALGSGAVLVIPNDGDRSGEALRSVLVTQQVTHLTLPAIVLTTFEPGDDLPLQCLVVAGEACPGELVQRWSAGRRMINAYGPTETTVAVTLSGPLSGSQTPPIGSPIRKTRVYVLNSALEPTPIGVYGELYVAGAGLARGYTNRPDLTSERFVADLNAPVPGQRMYRTGDMVRWRDGGTLDFAGRSDHQVKIRGYRVEPGDIEAALRQYWEIRDAVVVVREERKGDKRLVAYVVGEEGVEPGVPGIRAYLKERLPGYMVPAAYVVMSQIPMTQNGKIDRGALPAPVWVRKDSDGGSVRVRTPVEEVISNIWAEVLGLERVGVEDNFFDIGGHSLLATQVISRMREAFDLEVAVRELFESPTVVELARVVDARLGDDEGPRMPVLTRVDPAEGLLLSFAQQRLWFIEQLRPGTPAYNMASGMRMEGKLCIEELKRSFVEIVTRHESLRTCFPEEGGTPRQEVLGAGTFSMREIDLRANENGVEGVGNTLWDLIAEEAKQPFDLRKGPLFRATLVRVGEQDHVLVMVMHHIIADGWSIGLFYRELKALYRAYLEGEESPLAALPIQYRDYAAWQREWLTGTTLDEQLSYWRAHLAGAPPLLELPADRPRPATPAFRAGYHQLQITAELSGMLNVVSRRERVTLFMTLLAGFQVILSRYSGQGDIVVGTPIAGRRRAELEGLIGLFVNTLALRIEMRGDPAFRELLRRVREMCLGAYAHQDVPFEKLVEELQPERSASHAPVFQVTFALQNAPGGRMELSGMRMSPVNVTNGIANYDLSLSLQNAEDGIAVAIEYGAELFDPDSIKRIGNHYVNLLAAAVADIDRGVSQLGLMSENERRQILWQWNQTSGCGAGDLPLPQLFETQACTCPDAVAVVHAEHSVSYSELNASANRLAHYLIRLGLGPERLAGIAVERSIEMVTAVLATSKAGAAYLPLDPDYPQARLARMIDDAKPAVVLSTMTCCEILPPVRNMLLLNSPEVRVVLGQCPSSNPTDVDRICPLLADHLAYVIYTSGSTGGPKGVGVAHTGIGAMAAAQIEKLSVTRSSRVLQFASLSFDASLWELVMALSTGAALVLPDAADRSGAALRSVLVTQQVTHLTLPPIVLGTLEPGGGLSLECLVVAGEACPAEMVRQWSSSQRMINAYGPTETTVCATMSTPLTGSHNPPIGSPIWKTRVYVLNGALEAAPIGVRGDLYVAGSGLARGYLNQPGVSAERFLPDPYASQPGSRMYRTGDVAHWRVEQTLAFVGRADQQVKIRGYRIELGEIEALLRRHQSVKEAVVVARPEGPSEKILVAYVVAQAGEDVDGRELRRYLAERLPHYMVPRTCVLLEQMPLTLTGKVDYLQLPGPAGTTGEDGARHTPPRDGIEVDIAAIWRELLGVERVGIYENFFDLGGHSLLALRLMARIEKHFGRRLGLAALIEGPTIEHLAGLLREGRREAYPSLLVTLQARGSRIPFFCVHPAGGHVTCYRELAHHLGPEQPFHGLQAQGLGDNRLPLQDVRAMASKYIDELYRVRPEGPYALGGWSFGAIVAFEMAQQLVAQGRHVALLALFDPTNLRALKDRGAEDESVLLLDFAQDLGIPRQHLLSLLDRLPQIDPDEALRLVVDQGKVSNLLSAEADLSAIRRHFQIFKGNAFAASRYVPRPYPGRMNLFRPIETPHEGRADPIQAWSDLATGGVALHLVPGTHFTMVLKPHVRALAEELGECLKLASASTPQANSRSRIQAG